VIDIATERLISIPKAAQLLGRHRDTVRAMVERGDLEAVIVGKHSYTTKEAVERSIARCTQVARESNGPNVPVLSTTRRQGREAEEAEALKAAGVLPR
jgi:excisionase family DNA binding protein